MPSNPQANRNEIVTETNAFVFEVGVYLKDTNLFGGVYFSRFFEWQGMAREAFLKSSLPNMQDFFRSGVQLITMEASILYESDLSFHDSLSIRVNTHNVNQASLELIFLFVRKGNGDIVAVGKQKVCFGDSNRRVVPMPDLVQTRAKEFLWERDGASLALLDGTLKARLTRKGFFAE